MSDGRRAAAVLRRVEPADAGLHQSRGRAGAGGRLHLLHRKRRAAVAAARACAALSELHGVELDPEREIVITASGVQALNVAIRCMLDPGDEALVLTPAWPNGSSIIAMANAQSERDPASAVPATAIRSISTRSKRAVTPRTRTAAVHVAVESAGLGGDGRRSAAAARFLPPPRSLADGRRSLRPALSTTGARKPG